MPDPLASLIAENEDMKARLRAIAQIVNGGAIVEGPIAEGQQSKSKVYQSDRTPNCNCDAVGIPNPMAHALGCPFSPVMRPAKVGEL